MKKAAKHPIDRTKPASIIADKFGGLVEFCKALTKARMENEGKTVAPSTVSRWLVKGYIPFEWHPIVNRAAELERVKIKPSDYLEARAPAVNG